MVKGAMQICYGRWRGDAALQIKMIDTLGWMKYVLHLMGMGKEAVEMGLTKAF
jgi:hypothetical protein